jgi:2-keto-4-pentenoate hydratase
MNTAAALQAARLLWRHHCADSVLDALPDALRPADEAQGHAIRAQLPQAAGQPVAGWKIAATSQAGQRQINVSGPLPGRDAVATLHPAFEVPDSRFAVFTRAGQAQLIADNACCVRFALAPAARDRWRALDLAAHAVRGTVRGADGARRLRRARRGRAALRRLATGPGQDAHGSGRACGGVTMRRS